MSRCDRVRPSGDTAAVHSSDQAASVFKRKLHGLRMRLSRGQIKQ